MSSADSAGEESKKKLRRALETAPNEQAEAKTSSGSALSIAPCRWSWSTFATRSCASMSFHGCTWPRATLPRMFLVTCPHYAPSLVFLSLHLPHPFHSHWSLGTARHSLTSTSALPSATYARSICASATSNGCFFVASSRRTLLRCACLKGRAKCRRL